MSTFMQITRKADGSVQLDLDTAMFAGLTASDPAPSETTQSAAKAPTKAATKATKASTAKAPAKARKPKRDGKAIYAEIRRLTRAGEHDAARDLAAATGWEHVVESVSKHEAKRAEKPAELVKDTSAKRPAKRPARSPRKARANAPKPNRSQAFPPAGQVGNEAELVLWWTAKAKQGDRNCLLGAKMLTGKAIQAAIRSGDKREAGLQRKRLAALTTLLAAMTAKAKAA